MEMKCPKCGSTTLSIPICGNITIGHGMAYGQRDILPLFDNTGSITCDLCGHEAMPNKFGYEEK